MSNPRMLSIALLSAALCLTACGVAPRPAAAPERPATAGLKALALAPLEGPLTAGRVLAFAHTAARQLDGKAAFTGMTGVKIGHEGVPVFGGSWTVTYLGGEVEPPKGQRNGFEKWTRRLTVTVSDKGQPTVRVREEAGMPLGVSFLDSPIPELDSQEVVRILAKERPASAPYPVARMILTGHPRDFEVLLWKVVGAGTQSGERPLTLNAHTGAVLSTPY